MKAWKSLPLLFAAAAVLARGAFLAATGATFEDSLISLRYAENLAAGLGMVFNPGERVFGASTPLYVLLLAGLTRMGVPALAVAKGLAMLADGATLLLWTRWLLRREAGWMPACLFGLLFGLSPLMVHVGVSGMETPFALLLLTLALLAELQDRPALLGVSLGLLVLVRPDGAIAAAVLLAARWRRTERVPWLPAALAALLVLPWLAAATVYYGTPLPNSIPAKAAAYNLHRPGLLPNLPDTLSYLAPIRGHWGRLLTNLIFAICLIAGLRRAWKEAPLRPLLALFGVWWAYLVLPRTLLFTWYFPIFLLPAVVLAALGLSELLRGGEGARRERWGAGGLALLVVGLSGWTGWAPAGASPFFPDTAGALALRVQRAEEGVRRPIGLWLRENTPEGARVAAEPIGYVGYYSRRRLLDEVGLVSPEMIPLNREGAGWFAAMLRRFSPDFVLERPGFLLRNLTINSRVPMFRTAAERREFHARYRAAAAFSTTDLPRSLVEAYRFVIFARRTPEEAEQWRRRLAETPPEDREALLVRATLGPEGPPARPAPGGTARPPRR